MATKNRAILKTETEKPAKSEIEDRRSEIDSAAEAATAPCPRCEGTQIETHHANGKSRCATCGHWH